MRGFTPFLLLLAAKAGITTGHVFNTHHDGRRIALSAVHDSIGFDMLFPRLDPRRGQFCGICMQIILDPVVAVLLVSDGIASAGDLNPAVLEAAGIDPVTIVIRNTLVYSDNAASDPSQQLSLVVEKVVEPGDWNEETCSYLEEDCILFQSDGVLLFAPDAPGGLATLSLDDLNEFTDDSSISIISNTCDVRCQDTGVCNALDALLHPTGTGLLFGNPVQSTFNNGFCNPSTFGISEETGLYSQRYDWFGADGGWYAYLPTEDQLLMNHRVTSHLPETFPERQLVTGVAVVTDGGQTMMDEAVEPADVVDPADLAPTCQDNISAEAISALLPGKAEVSV